MRILLVSHYGLPHLGGIEVVVDALASRLVLAGHEVTHICSSAVRRDDPTDMKVELSYRRVLLRAFNAAEEHLGFPYPLFGPLLPIRLWQETGRADVVHIHGLLYENSLAAALIAAFRRKPVVITEHVGEVPYRNRALRFLQKLAFISIGRCTLGRGRALIVLNGRVEREMRRLNRNVRIVTLSNGVDTERFRPGHPEERESIRMRLGWNDERKRLLLVGRIVEKKGISLAVEAASALGGEYEILLVGPGSISSLPRNVIAVGAKPVQYVAEMYRAADALLLPSRGEGFPLAVQEALASGLPVFVPRDPDYVAILEGAGDAVQFFDSNPQDIARTVEAFFSRVDAGLVVRDEAARFARQRFSWDVVVQRHLDLYGIR